MRSSGLILGVLGLLGGSLSGCGAPPEADLGWTLEALPSPARGTSSAPQLTVEGDRAILSWLESADSRAVLKFAERTREGWSEPRVVTSGEDVIVNTADVPSVRALADGTLVAHWLQANGPDPEAYQLPLSWSKDGGRTWSPPTNPHHDGTETQHGFASLFPAPDGGVGLVWLDGRAGSSIGLWAAAYDSSGRQTSEIAIDPLVCDCCQTSVSATPDASVVVAYRGRTVDEVRDIQVTRFVDGHWSTPALVHQDGWKIDGCPVNGPAVSARGRDVAVAWFTGATGAGQSFAAFSQDGGRTFGGPVRVDDGVSKGYVDIELLADGVAAVSWSEFADGRSQFRVRQIERSGRRSPAIIVADHSGMHYPRLASTRDELLLAWVETEDDYTRVRTARVPR